MHEKTLLYAALGVTAIAASFGVYKAKTDSGGGPMNISPVSLIESAKGVPGAEVPVRLTSSDGTGLKLVSLRAEAAVEDPLALTELHLTFENPEDRVLEGTFRITLPQGASLSRFAMKVGGAWQEGEVVEKQAARQAYEDFLHRKQDPALMEQGAGNEFSARVFPIPARGTKEIIVTYAEAIAIGAAYVLPLKGLPQLGALDVNVHVAGSKGAEQGGKTDALFGVHQQRFTPAADFVVEGNKVPRSPGLRNGDLAITRIIPFAQSRPEPIKSAVILVDTSASRGLGIGEQAKALQAILSKIPGDTHIVVACFDQDVAPIYEGNASGFGQKEVTAIISRGALGASDFEQAIDWAADQAKKSKSTRVIMLTDGVATAGETDAQKLKTKVEALRGAGVTRMDAIAMGGIRDDGFLRTIARGVLDRDGVVLDAKLGTDALARRLGEATSSGIEVKVDGAKWAWPEKLDGLQAGDEVLVYTEMDPAAGGGGGGSKPISIDVSGQKFTPDLRTIDRPLVERAWAQAKIQSLIEAPKDSPSATKNQIVNLSTHHRVLSPHTALLVLESDSDYRRFNIDRTAKVDILGVEEGRAVVLHNGRSWEEERDKDIRRGSPEKKVTTGTRAKGEEGAMNAQPTTIATATAAAAAAAAAPSPRPGTGGGSDLPAADPAAAVAGPRGGSPDDFGAQGLGLSGTGEGGGGRGDGIGLGRAAAENNRPAPPPPAEAAARDEVERSLEQAGQMQRRAAAPAPLRARGTTTTPCMPGDPLCGDDHRTGGGGAVARPPSQDRADREANVEGQVRPGSLTGVSGISPDEVQRVVRGAVSRIRTCYTAQLTRNRTAHGRLQINFVVDQVGEVKSADLGSETPGDDTFKGCVSAIAKSLRFPAPGSGDARFSQQFDLVNGSSDVVANLNNPPEAPKALPYEGRFKVVMEALQRQDKDGALKEANQWHADQPGDVLSLVALGEVFEARNDLKSAARAYGSILELFSFRADSRRFAGERLERLHGDARALALAADTYGKSAEQRPDHPASHRLYAYSLVKKGEYEKAFEAIKKGAQRTYPGGRFRGVDRILKEDMGLIAAAWMKAQPQRTAEIKTTLREGGGTEESGPSLRFVLVWETDANDVDFHIRDGKGGHAFYSQMHLDSGGDLYADVTTGYGPECFTIRKPREQRSFPYTLQAHYYSRGPMGYGMGKMQIIDHDGKGGLSFDERPFVVMIDKAFVDMGTVDKSTKLEALNATATK